MNQKLKTKIKFLDQQIFYIIQQKTLDAYQMFLEKFLENYISLPISPNLLQSPVIVIDLLFKRLLKNDFIWNKSFKIQEPIYGEINPQFINYMVPVIITCFFLFGNCLFLNHII